MKVMTIVGTRPELIRLSLIIPKLDKYCEHVLIHTGQNYNPLLKDIFFEELGIRAPDYVLECKTMGDILNAIEPIILKEAPDKILILGDTNSGLSTIVAKKMGISVIHMEAGNRCYDDRVPEETNRRVIDHSSDILLPYTERSRQNLIREGISNNRIFVTGNPIEEVIGYYSGGISKSNVLRTMGIFQGRYFLATFHRAENVDNEKRLVKIIDSLKRLNGYYMIPVICSVHPHTKKRIGGINIEGLTLHEPFGFFDFVNLESNALCVISDSGTVQEECSLLHIPNVTIRDTTERPETVECGSNIISGTECESVLRCVKMALDMKDWKAPVEYKKTNVSDTVVKIVCGYHEV
jgi:UDP-N-acetylglucosamine 2-epimerase (non-hydrolysing)